MSAILRVVSPSARSNSFTFAIRHRKTSRREISPTRDCRELNEIAEEIRDTLYILRCEVGRDGANDGKGFGCVRCGKAGDVEEIPSTARMEDIKLFG